MTVKTATKYATKFASQLTGLKGELLTEKIAELVRAENRDGLPFAAKDLDAIANAFRQLPAETFLEKASKFADANPNTDLLGALADKGVAKVGRIKIPAKKAKVVKKAAKNATPAKKAAGPREPRMGTTYILFRELIKGRTPEQALAAALKAYPKAPTNAASAAWCKSQLNCTTAYAKRYTDHFTAGHSKATKGVATGK